MSCGQPDRFTTWDEAVDALEAFANLPIDATVAAEAFRREINEHPEGRELARRLIRELEVWLETTPKTSPFNLINDEYFICRPDADRDDAGQTLIEAIRFEMHAYWGREPLFTELDRASSPDSSPNSSPMKG